MVVMVHSRDKRLLKYLSRYVLSPYLMVTTTEVETLILFLKDISTMKHACGRVSDIVK